MPEVRHAGEPVGPGDGAHLLDRGELSAGELADLRRAVRPGRDEPLGARHHPADRALVGRVRGALHIEPPAGQLQQATLGRHQIGVGIRQGLENRVRVGRLGGAVGESGARGRRRALTGLTPEELLDSVDHRIEHKH